MPTSLISESCFVQPWGLKQTDWLIIFWSRGRFETDTGTEPDTLMLSCPKILSIIETVMQMCLNDLLAH